MPFMEMIYFEKNALRDELTPSTRIKLSNAIFIAFASGRKGKTDGIEF